MELVDHHYRDTMELHEFFKQVPLPLVIFHGPEHLFVLTNHAYDELVDRPVIGKTVSQAFDCEEVGEFISLLDGVYYSEIPYRGKELFFPKKNTEGVTEDCWVDVEYHPFYGKGEKIIGVLGFVHNVTAVVKTRKMIEKNEMYYRLLALDLEAESELKEIFISTLSHDLRTPLTIATLSANTLAKNLIEIPSLNKIALRISSAMIKADKMIQNLLDASFIKAGEKLPIIIRPVCMNKIIEAVVEDLSSIHENRFQFFAPCEVNGFWDDEGIRRVLENLLLNAIKYGYAKSLVTIKLSIVDNTVSISVHNEGDLVTADELITIFSRFKRVNSNKKNEQKGWGLGLTLVKGIIEAHRGTIYAKSVAGEGTTFIIELPLDSTGIYN